MTRKSPDGTEAVPRSADFSEFARLGTRQFETCLEVQSALTHQLQEANANWLKRLQQEGALASDLAVKLTAARTVPETAAAWQDWLNQHVALMGQDTRHAMSDAQSFIAIGSRAFTSGWRATAAESPGST